MPYSSWKEKPAQMNKRPWNTTRIVLQFFSSIIINTINSVFEFAEHIMGQTNFLFSLDAVNIILVNTHHLWVELTIIKYITAIIFV